MVAERWVLGFRLHTSRAGAQTAAQKVTIRLLKVSSVKKPVSGQFGLCE
jgi:hypothetical protein